VARFQESLSIKGVRLTASTQLVLQLFCAKPSVAGLPSKEALVAWAVTPLLSGGQVGVRQDARSPAGLELALSPA
jgi:hypothetical protein